MANENNFQKAREEVIRGDYKDFYYLAQAQYADFTWHKDWRDLFNYKFNNAVKGDCDRSPVALVTYELIYDYLDLDEKNRCKTKSDRYYSGDFTTSAITSFKLYLQYKLQEGNVSMEFSKLFALKNGIICTPPSVPEDDYKGLTDYIYKNISNSEFVHTVSNELTGEVNSFIYNCFKSGNFIAVPECFNSPRSNFGNWDTVDRMMWKIYQYFENGKDIEYLKQLFKHDQDEAACNCINWFEDAGINSWEDFVRVNLLAPFTDDNLVPICLKTGEAIKLPITEQKYEPMPANLAECEVFFKTVNKGIIKRSDLIWDKINKRL